MYVCQHHRHELFYVCGLHRHHFTHTHTHTEKLTYTAPPHVPHTPLHTLAWREKQQKMTYTAHCYNFTKVLLILYTHTHIYI